MKAGWSLVLLVAPAIVLGGSPEKGVSIGKKVDDFTLREYRGAEKSLSGFAKYKLLVVTFMGTECPVAKLYGPRLAELAGEFGGRGVGFVGISSNQQDSPSAIGEFVKTAHITFPILKDVGNVVADQFGALRTPETFVLDQDRIIRYRGCIDDQYGVGYLKKKIESRDLANALADLLAGRPVARPLTEARGCYIGRVRHEVKNNEITYSKHIAPILQKNCVECHRPAEIGPFSLTSYDEVVGWADTIQEVVRDRRMPPWHADPKYGEFSNERKLAAADKKMIDAWVDNGAPEGDSKDLPKPAEIVPGWRIPKPDVVLSIPTAFNVPAQGDVPYQFFIIDPGIKEDKWVRAAEIRPGCRAVVHHVLAFAQPPGGGTDKYGGFAANWLAATVPGSPVLNLPDGYAKFLPAGSRFMVQIHYTTNGAPQTDITSIGLVFADPKTVKKEVITEMAANANFAIPPHDPKYEVDSTYFVEQDSMLLDMSPHTHLRGKTFQYKAVYPDGKKEILLDLPRYDFNWQTTYVLAKPKLLVKGTQIQCVATYDNSVKNLSNPNPDAEVRWGDQTWEEMMIGYFNVVPVNQDLQRNPRPIGRYVPKKLPILPSDLQELAVHALESPKAFDAFAGGVRQHLPKVDRVCLTSIYLGNLKVEWASYPGNVSKQVAKAGFEGHSQAYALPHFGIIGMLISFPDTSQAPGIDMKMLSQTLGSSVHVPVVMDGRPATLNFWSAEKKAFPESGNDFLRALAKAVIRGK